MALRSPLLFRHHGRPRHVAAQHNPCCHVYLASVVHASTLQTFSKFSGTQYLAFNGTISASRQYDAFPCQVQRRTPRIFFPLHHPQLYEHFNQVSYKPKEMTTRKPTYFLAPSRPYPPSGPIQLASIIPSYKLPDEPLYTPPAPDASSVSELNEKDWSGSHIYKKSSSFGVWTSFLEFFLGAGIDLHLKSNSELVEKWAIKDMCTMSFVPTTKYIEEVVQKQEVLDYVVGNFFREKIYMVTGIMVASGAHSVKETLEERGVYVHAGVDLLAWTGIPLSVGPEGKLKKKEAMRVVTNTEEAFVFAFRVREIRLKRKGGVKDHKLYSQGALFGLDKAREVLKKVYDEEIEVEGLGEEADEEEFKIGVKHVLQAGDEDVEEECLVVLPEED
ncbi:hypothetical protein P154DRAFT_559949 [Amniculicola lignicola CBS 123094]|uniref:Uncharacterized protein n=1 Tax=Amniculicola lignicola CBS 123094 TaxID=1392246 RepID=A0A6A5X2G1_9PLEO|nr:hypothetical protein P154DRAFT_559949 [Amniculicola lignicola CBS 123094]